MFEAARISPSILSADFMHLADEIDDIERAGADLVHIDVMDGHFVPNLTIGVPLLNQIARSAHIPLDVHLMIDNPLVQLPWYLAASPDYVTIHWEALGGRTEALEASALIRSAGVHAGIALRPDTPTSVLEGIYDAWDMVLVMSVQPGFSGQAFMPASIDRVEQVVRAARQEGACPRIQVDGGISAETAALVGAVGADVLVAGNAVFKAADRAQAIDLIRGAANNARTSVS